MKEPVIFARKTVTIHDKPWVVVGYKNMLEPDHFKELTQLFFLEFSGKFVKTTKKMLIPEKDWAELEKWFALKSTQRTYPYFYLDNEEDEAFVQATLNMED